MMVEARAAGGRHAALDRPAVRRLTWTTIGAGGLAASVAASFAFGPALGIGTGGLALVAALSVSAYLLHSGTFSLRWRDQAAAISLDEGVLFVALLALPLPLAPLLFVVPVALAQPKHRRPALKAAFNVGNTVAGAGLAALVSGALVGLVPAELAALLGVGVFTVATNANLALVLALAGGGSAREVYRRRLVLATVFQVGFGASAGIIAIALWAYSPFALLGVVPLILLARAYATYHVRSERVVNAHEGIARLARQLVDAEQPDRVAEEVLSAVGELLPAASATLALEAAPGSDPRVWTRAFGRRLHDWACIEAPLVSRTGMRMGMLLVDVDRRSGPGTDMDPAIAKLLASEAATALERAVLVQRARATWSETGS